MQKPIPDIKNREKFDTHQNRGKFGQMISVKIKDGESGEKLLRRFAKHVKNTRIQKLFRKSRYFAQKPTQTKTRAAAISREKYRAVAKKKQFTS